MRNRFSKILAQVAALLFAVILPSTVTATELDYGKINKNVAKLVSELIASDEVVSALSLVFDEQGEAGSSFEKDQLKIKLGAELRHTKWSPNASSFAVDLKAKAFPGQEADAPTKIDVDIDVVGKTDALGFFKFAYDQMADSCAPATSADKKYTYYSDVSEAKICEFDNSFRRAGSLVGVGQDLKKMFKELSEVSAEYIAFAKEELVKNPEDEVYQEELEEAEASKSLVDSLVVKLEAESFSVSLEKPVNLFPELDLTKLTVDFSSAEVKATVGLGFSMPTEDYLGLKVYTKQMLEGVEANDPDAMDQVKGLADMYLDMIKEFVK